MVKRLFKSKFVRFAFVAALNTAVGYGFYAFFTFIGFHFTIAALCGTVLGMLFNFKSYGHLVFKDKSNKIIFRFAAVYALLYFTNIGGIALLNYWGVDEAVHHFIAERCTFIETYHIDLAKYMGALIMVVPNGLLGFYLNNKFVFNLRSQEIEKEELQQAAD